MLLKNKTAVITGCNRGIGKKILEVFSVNGATVFACVRNISKEFEAEINNEQEFMHALRTRNFYPAWLNRKHGYLHPEPYIAQD